MPGGLGLYGPLESKTPRHGARRKSKTGQPQAPYSRRRRVRAPNAGPRADCGRGDAVAARRATALAQPTPPPHGSGGRGLLARRSNRCDNWWHGCPLRRLPQTRGSRSRDRHGVIGEMASRSAYRGARHRDKPGRQRWISTFPALASPPTAPGGTCCPFDAGPLCRGRAKTTAVTRDARHCCR
jgi:hypothetical protein